MSGPGGLVVGLEPSCTAVFRTDAPELFPGDRNVRRLRDRTVTLAELLTDHSPGYEPPHVPDRSARAVAQVHCHQHAVLDWTAGERLLRRAGVDVERLDSGCCGLADGFSCRTQIHGPDSGGHEAVHAAELLASALRGADGAGGADSSDGAHPTRPPGQGTHPDRSRPHGGGGGDGRGGSTTTTAPLIGERNTTMPVSAPSRTSGSRRPQWRWNARVSCAWSQVISQPKCRRGHDLLVRRKPYDVHAQHPAPTCVFDPLPVAAAPFP